MMALPVIVLCSLLTVSALAYEEDDEMQNVEDAEYWQKIITRGLFDCKKHSESCSGFPKCCGTLQCFWEEGYSVTKSGICVPCVDRELKCQRNEQCCEPLVCQKNDLYSVDGVCDRKRPLGANCYRDSQCESDECEIAWLAKLKREAGTCATKTKRELFEDNIERNMYA